MSLTCISYARVACLYCRAEMLAIKSDMEKAKQEAEATMRAKEEAEALVRRKEEAVAMIKQV
jgi:hypothetical protein